MKRRSKLLGAVMPLKPRHQTETGAVKFLTAKDVADMLAVSPKRVYELAQRCEIPSVRIGQRQLRFIESEILDWARNGGTPSQDLPHTFENIGPTRRGVQA